MLYALLMWFIIMSFFAIVGTVLLLQIDNRIVVDEIMVLMTAYSIIIAYLNAIARTTDSSGLQILGWVIGSIAVISTGIKFLTKKQTLIYRILVAGSVDAGLFYFFFL